MNYDEMYLAINKGVPNMTSVDIPIGTLIMECASDQSKLVSEIHQFRKDYETLIGNRMGYSKAQLYFCDSLRVLTNYRTSETTLHVSPVDFLIKLKNILGVDYDSLDFDDLILREELLYKLEILKKINNPEELKEKFPLIYEDYELSFRAYNKIKSIKEEMDRTKNVGLKFRLDEKWKYYRLYGLSTNFSVFMDHQVKMYRNFIVRRQFMESDTRNNPLDLSKFDGLDKSKFELYLAYRYLLVAKFSKDENEIQGALYYISSYLNEASNSKDVLTLKITGDNGEIVSFKTIYHGLKYIMRKHPTLKPIPEDRSHFKNYHMKHVVNHMNKYYGNNVQWVMLRPGTVYRNLGNLCREKGSAVLSPEEMDRRMVERFNQLHKKIEFYENSGYLFMAVGINHFVGYLAFFYPNGEVLMDKWYCDSFGIMPAYDEAIYNIGAGQYEKLSSLDKQTLKKKYGVKTLNHTDTWTTRAQKIVDAPGLPENIEAVKTLELKYKK